MEIELYTRFSRHPAAIVACRWPHLNNELDQYEA
jgi:hypothetical protein